MKTFTEEEYIEKMNSLPKELNRKLLLLDFDNEFVSIIDYNRQRRIHTIAGEVRCVALGYSSKQELFEAISSQVASEEEAKHIFGEIDRIVLRPNNIR
jgi:hypothetical protein